ncbi:MAG: inositol-3-phosphate synthase [Phycisphaerae bacterium]
MNDSKIRIAIVGLGNCASTLVQGIGYYRSSGDATGLMHPVLAGWQVGDITIACAFDVDERKIGQRVGRAIFAKPNNSRVFFSDPQDDGAVVYAGPIGDGAAGHLAGFDASQRLEPSAKSRSVGLGDVVRILRQTEAQVLVNYLPVGSQQATELYAHACLEAGVAMVNCIPVFIASDAAWAGRFAAAGLPIIGDDVKSQFGATIVHRQLMSLAEQRGIQIDSSYQLNVGGNADFLNMLERGRLASKKVSKTEAVNSQLRSALDDKHIHIGPSDYIAFLADNKVCYVRINGRGFGGLPLELDLKLSVEDSPNSAGIVVDAVRCAALARRRGIGGPLGAVSAALMKHPPEQMTDQAAASAMERWIT